MDDSILNTIKGMLGIDNKSEVYDQDLIVYINSVFSTLYQIGVADKAAHLVDKHQTWSSVFTETPDLVDLIKEYTYVKVRMIFDPPTSSFVLDSLKKMSEELEWRIHVQAEGRFEDE